MKDLHSSLGFFLVILISSFLRPNFRNQNRDFFSRQNSLKPKPESSMVAMVPEFFKSIFQGRAYFPIYWNLHSSSNIKNKTSKDSQNSFKWTQAPQRRQLSKCGPGCPEREEFAKEEVRPCRIRSSGKWRRWWDWSLWDGCQKLWSWWGW